MRELVLIHLSDIHFTGSSGRSVHDLDSEVRNELVRDAATVAKECGGATGVLVTGDISYSGQRDEYERAASWLLELCRAIGCPDESVWVVPGNHDVDREIANSKVTRTLHESIRSRSGVALDDELKEILTDENSANALLAPLAEYNAFAARFQCAMSAKAPFWERDLKLVCGTVIRLRGLCSALVSNREDTKSNLVLGQAQVNIHRTDGIYYITLCHHPPDWLKDQDTVTSHLESKARIQLFGHKHTQRVQEINKTLRITAGAMHPERNESDWEPMYNVIQLRRDEHQQLSVRLFQRRWHKNNHHFLAEQDPRTNEAYHEYFWDDCPPPEPHQSPAVATPAATPSDGETSHTLTIEPTAKDTGAMPPPNPERRLTFRFLTLSFRHQIAVAQALNVLTDDDRALSGEALFSELFRRASAHGLLAKLWDETEKRHADPAPYNPFENSEQ